MMKMPMTIVHIIFVIIIIVIVIMNMIILMLNIVVNMFVQYCEDVVDQRLRQLGQTVIPHISTSIGKSRSLTSSRLDRQGVGECIASPLTWSVPLPG